MPRSWSREKQRRKKRALKRARSNGWRPKETTDGGDGRKSGTLYAAWRKEAR